MSSHPNGLLDTFTTVIYWWNSLADTVLSQSHLIAVLVSSFLRFQQRVQIELHLQNKSWELGQQSGRNLCKHFHWKTYKVSNFLKFSWAGPENEFFCLLNTQHIDSSEKTWLHLRSLKMIVISLSKTEILFTNLRKSPMTKKSIPTTQIKEITSMLMEEL